MPNTVKKSDYRRLLGVIRQEIQRGVSRIQRMVDIQKVVTYWRVGRLIDTHMLKDRAQAGHGERLFERLALDLDVNERLLHQAVQFYRLYPALPKGKGLCWSHYRNLITISDARERKRWEHRIVREGWSSNQLLEYRRKDQAQKIKNEPASSVPLPLARGRLYTYRLIKINTIRALQGNVLIDCGFDIRIPLPPSRGTFRAGGLVESSKSDTQYRVKHVFTDRLQIYTYIALPERVVDGDTIVVHIDCGFGIWVRQRLRLRGIDAYEMTTHRGRQAKKFVIDQLKAAPFVVIKTYGSDKYDRYLVDVFYLPGENAGAVVAMKGRLLNQELLDQRLATRYGA